MSSYSTSSANLQDSNMKYDYVIRPNVCVLNFATHPPYNVLKVDKSFKRFAYNNNNKLKFNNTAFKINL